jgi:hypothetical protein
LARYFVHQQSMIPSRAVAPDQAPRAIERVGLGSVVADPDRDIGMEWANRGGARRQERIANHCFQIVRFRCDGHCQNSFWDDDDFYDGCP